MRMPTMRTLAIVGALSLVMALPTTANAQENSANDDERHSIEDVKERAAEAIERRLATLDRLTEKASTSPHLTDEHETALLGDYRVASNGLEQLGDDIAQAQTAEELRSLVPLIAKDYRVYLVIVPKSAEVGASDRVRSAVERLSAVATTLHEAADRAEAAGFDVTETRRWLISAADEIAEANRTGVPVADLVIDLDAGDWEEPAKSTLEDGKRRLENARVDLRQAHGSLEKAREALRDAIDR
ncbi:MAG: hypothetical protein QNJ71_04620 [Acidimicrobiia bacterium]|nr:hypothetical protein [Acidimicrobiia bacterium]